MYFQLKALLEQAQLNLTEKDKSLIESNKKIEKMLLEKEKSQSDIIKLKKRLETQEMECVDHKNTIENLQNENTTIKSLKSKLDLEFSKCESELMNLQGKYDLQAEELKQYETSNAGFFFLKPNLFF